MSIRLFETQTSMFCEKVRVVLRMKNIPYEVVDVRNDRQPLIDYSGGRKVPVMDHNGERVIDSTFICAFLEERYPQATIYPGSASDKGLCLMLEDWADEVLNQAIRMLRRAENPAARKEAEKGMEIHFETLDRLLTGRGFIFGRLTLADIAIFAELHYLYTVIKYEIPARFKNLHAWMDLVRCELKLATLQDVAA